MTSVVIAVFRWLAWLAFLTCTLLIIANSVQDFGPSGEGIFVSQKGDIGRQPLWLFCMNVHVVAGIVCMLSILPQLSRVVLRRFPELHRWSGRIYAACVLLVLCPTGMYLAVFAKGGLAGQASFLLLGVVTFFTTLRGITAMLGSKRNLAAHRAAMVRSFAFTSSAITFRLYHVLFFWAGLPNETNYNVSLWLSILGNAAMAELALRARRPRIAVVPASLPSIP